MLPAAACADNTLTAVSEGSPFPGLKAQDLTDRFITLPSESKGRVTLITAAFSRPEEGIIESWTGPFADKFSGRDDTAYYEIAMIGDVGWVSIFIFNGIKGGTPENKKEHVLVFWEKTKGEFREIFSAEDDSLIYVFLLDKEGIIRLKTSGLKAENKDIETLLSAAESLIKPLKK